VYGASGSLITQFSIQEPSILSRFTFHSKSIPANKYRPEVDGMRALAVLSVLFFHAKISGFSGGFVGVDIFYVISGFLITSIILADLDRDRFSFVLFYERRMRRIFPALFTVVLFCVLAAGVVFVPKDFAAFGKSLIAATLFVSNVFFKREAGIDGYFDRSSDSQALLHTWSLSVEEQFYLLFPIGLILLIRWTKGRKARYLLSATVVSFAICIWATQYRSLSAFYMLVPRAWELLIGSLLAMKIVPPLKRRVARELLGLLGLGLIAWSIFMFTKDTPFPGLNAVFPCVGAWLIIYAGADGASTVRTALSFPPAVAIGVVSYSGNSGF